MNDDKLWQPLGSISLRRQLNKARTRAAAGKRLL